MPRRSHRTLLASLLAILGACPGPPAAQSPRRFHRPVRPTDRTRVGIDTAARTALRDTVQAILDRGVADSAFPGAIAVIGTHAGPLVTVSSGHLDWAPSPAPTTETLWDVASLTKVVGMTSAMMQLGEERKVEL